MEKIRLAVLVALAAAFVALGALLTFLILHSIAAPLRQLIAAIDGFGDRGAISLYVVERGAMRELYCNDSILDSLGVFYAIISSTQGGWTLLSSEGRYMGAAAWGNYDRATDPWATFSPDGTAYFISLSLAEPNFTPHEIAV